MAGVRGVSQGVFDRVDGLFRREMFVISSACKVITVRGEGGSLNERKGCIPRVLD